MSTEEKVFDLSKIAVGDTVWFSGYWTTITRIRPDPRHPLETRVEGRFPHSTADAKIHFFSFTTSAPVSKFPFTRRFSDRVLPANCDCGGAVGENGCCLRCAKKA